ncbi:MAG: hypothetical protein JNK05_09490 [Myxococcales bacterium]|nr:hypothetical protein [Myxococcales bacterium]
MRPLRWKRALGALLTASVLAGCPAPCPAVVRTSDPIEAARCCGNRPADSNTCSACASQPSCAWCDNPANGAPNCQARGNGSQPSTCSSGWHTTTEGPEGCPQPNVVPPGGTP